MTRATITRFTLPTLTAMGLIAVASTAAAQSVGGCGYTVQTGTYGTWPRSHEAGPARVRPGRRRKVRPACSAGSRT